MVKWRMGVLSRLAIVTVLLASNFSAANMQQPAKGGDAGGPWGKAVDGLMCRLTLPARVTVGQPITAVMEIKNISDKKRSIIRYLEPRDVDYVALTIEGPKGKVGQTNGVHYGGMNASWFQSIGPGEVKRIEVNDLRLYFAELDPWNSRLRKQNDVPTGRFTVRLKFASPAVPPQRFEYNPPPIKGVKRDTIYYDVPADLFANHWAGQIEALPLSLELVPLGKDDLTVHEWGVFTVLNDAKYANADHKEEWGTLPKFFYRQFPKERLYWYPSAWRKPIVYFYSKPNPLQLRVKVTFAEGAPVVWWPAEPMDSSPGPQLVEKPKPFQSLTWNAWIGDVAPVKPAQGAIDGKQWPLAKVQDFPLPGDFWLQDARLPLASRVTVVGTAEEGMYFPGAKDRAETEGFIFYDGLVPAPDYLHCEKTDATTVTLRNGASFNLERLFIVDRRVKGQTGFAYVDGTKNEFKTGAARNIDLPVVAAKDWPAVGIKQFRQALLDAGLFEPEADSLIKIWQKRLLDSDGLIAFHILPANEYDRMLPLDILPVPAAKPVRVGIAFHPNLEIEPALRQRVIALIKDLDDEKFQKRESASKSLLEIGPVAIGLLRAELHKNISLELRRRIEGVLDRVDATEWMKMPEPEKKK